MFHKCKFGNIDKGYQYCIICGKARKVECSHKWEIKSESQVSTRNPYTGRTNVTQYVYLQQCIYCGELKEFRQKV